MNWIKFNGTEINTVPDTIFNVKTAYTFQLKVEDDIGEERVYTYPIPYVSIPLHLGRGGRNLGLGQFCDYSEVDRIDVGWKSYFNIGIGMRAIFEESSLTGGWGKGQILSDVFNDVDTTMIMDYNIFIAIVSKDIASGGGSFPILCMRMNADIYGSYGYATVQMHYYASQNTMSLTDITNGHTITALYALL